MPCVILSGAVAAGKTSVMRLLKPSLGEAAFGFSADECVKQAYEVSAVRKRLVDAFGEQMEPGLRQALADDETGEALKAWIREHVLPSPERRTRLEAILHPYVRQELEALRRQREGNLLVAEVPLHYETGAVISADLVIVVAASRSVQVRRMMESRGLDEATTQAFLNAQWPIEAKVEKADGVIWNDGDPSALEYQTLLLANLLQHE